MRKPKITKRPSIGKKKFRPSTSSSRAGDGEDVVHVSSMNVYQMDDDEAEVFNQGTASKCSNLIFM